MENFIRAYNDKGKHFDISYGLGSGIFRCLTHAAKLGIHLPNLWNDMPRSLNEMYLSFMDPAGEIINFQFIEKSSKPDWVRIAHQMYFKQGLENQRKFVLEHTDGGDWRYEFQRFIGRVAQGDCEQEYEKQASRFLRVHKNRMTWHQRLSDVKAKASEDGKTVLYDDNYDRIWTSAEAAAARKSEKAPERFIGDDRNLPWLKFKRR